MVPRWQQIRLLSASGESVGGYGRCNWIRVGAVALADHKEALMWHEDIDGLWFQELKIINTGVIIHGSELSLEYSRYRTTLKRLQPKPTPALLRYLSGCPTLQAHRFLLDFHNHVASGEYGHEVGKGRYAGHDRSYWFW